MRTAHALSAQPPPSEGGERAFEVALAALEVTDAYGSRSVFTTAWGMRRPAHLLACDCSHLGRSSPSAARHRTALRRTEIALRAPSEHMRAGRGTLHCVPPKIRRTKNTSRVSGATSQERTGEAHRGRRFHDVSTHGQPMARSEDFSRRRRPTSTSRRVHAKGALQPRCSCLADSPVRMPDS